MLNIDDNEFKLVIRIKGKPKKNQNKYFFSIPSAFIKNCNILPDKEYTIFVTEPVNKVTQAKEDQD